MPPMVWINGGLMVLLACLYLFAKPKVGERPQSKGMLVLGGVSVAAILIYLSRALPTVLAVLFIALALAVLVKTVLNLRVVGGGRTDQSNR